MEEFDNKINENTPRYISGWLAVFLWLGVGFGAVMTCFSTYLGWTETGVTPYSAMVLCTYTGCFLAVGILTIIAFYKRKNNAVSLAITYIGMAAIDGVFGILMSIILEDNSMMSTGIRSFVWATIWFIYLMCSTQVEERIPEKIRKTKPLEIVLFCVYIIMCAIIFREANLVSKHPEQSKFYPKKTLVQAVVDEVNKEFSMSSDDSVSIHIDVEYDEIVYRYRYSDTYIADFSDSALLYLKYWGMVQKQQQLQQYANTIDQEEIKGYDLMFNYGSVSYIYEDENGSPIYSFNISPDEYEQAISQGANFKCDDNVFKQQIEYYNQILPYDGFLGDCRLMFIQKYLHCLQYEVEMPSVTQEQLKALTNDYLENYLKQYIQFIADNLTYLAAINKLDICYCFYTPSGKLHTRICLPYQSYSLYLE